MKKYGVILSITGLLLVSLFLATCVPDRSRQPEALQPTETAQPDGPRLRIKNTGTVDITDLTVMFPESQVHFGTVPAGATTDYRPVPKGVYNYAAYKYMVDGKMITQPVTDWVGESPRPGDQFTYLLRIDPTRPTLNRIELIGVQNP